MGDTPRPRGREAGSQGKLVLGVDPGSTVTGWGLVRSAGQHLQCVESGVVRLRGERSARLARVFEEVRALCERLHPDVLSLEESFVGDNVQTAFRLGEARGAVMVAAALRGVPVVEYSPAGIKMAVVGSGRADKAQVQAMVMRLLGMTGDLVSDESDALAAAICHVHTRGFEDKIAQGVAFGASGRPGRARRARGGWS